MAWLVTKAHVVHAQSEAAPRPTTTSPVPTTSPSPTTTSPPRAEVTSEPASDERWLALRVGVGRSEVGMRRDYRGVLSTSGTELHVDLAYRVNAAVALGVHAGMTVGTMQLEEVYDMGSQHLVERSMRPIEIGASLQLSPIDRLWAAPWIGAVHIGGQIEQNRLAIGGSLGVDLLILPSGHRLGLYARGLQTSGYSFEDGIQAFMFGGSYGYR
jgi:hypothetical protein